MKKILFSILCVSLCLLSFVSCGKNSETTSESAESAIYFTQNVLTLSVGETVKAEIVTSKNNVYVFWNMRDESIATVSNQGEITGVSEGETICTVSYAGETAICIVKVTPKKATPLLSVNCNLIDNFVYISNGDSIDLTYFVCLGDQKIDGAEIEFELSVENVVTIANGVITAVSEGEVVITIIANYQGQTASTSIYLQVV